jgi:hypothetical protein
MSNECCGWPLTIDRQLQDILKLRMTLIGYVNQRNGSNKAFEMYNKQFKNG